ncbi:MAG: hypothetical protein R3F55_15160 [Alphaproteobacteria bacterium]
MVRKAILAAVALSGLAAPAFAFGGGAQPLLVETIAIDVDRWTHDETFPLRQLGGIGPQFNGYGLEGVKVEIGQLNPAGKVELLVNGQVVDSAFTANQHLVTLYPNPNADVFGQGVNTLQLRTVGWVEVGDIDLVVSHFGAPPVPPQPVCQSPERAINSDVNFTQLSLNTVFDLTQYPGCKIDSVTILANSALGGGQTSALVGGWQASAWTQVAAFPGQYTIDLWNDPATGANAQTVALNMMGFFDVQTVRLNLVAN